MRVPQCLFFLIILGSVGFAQNNVADLVLLDLQVFRCNAAMNETDAVAIKGDRIVALGKEQVTKWIDPETTCVIRDSKFVATAGFAESHLHFVGLGQALQMLDLRDAKSWQEIVAMVEKAAETLPAGTWIERRGRHQPKWNCKPANAIEG